MMVVLITIIASMRSISQPHYYISPHSLMKFFRLISDRSHDYFPRPRDTARVPLHRERLLDYLDSRNPDRQDKPLYYLGSVRLIGNQPTFSSLAHHHSDMSVASLFFLSTLTPVHISAMLQLSCCYSGFAHFRFRAC